MHLILLALARNLLIFFFVLASAAVKAQFADSLRDALHSQYSIDARLESRNSFIDNQLISVNGVRLGIAFKRKLRLGGGISWLNSEVSHLAPLSDDNSLALKRRYMKFVYLCYYVDVVFYKTKRWQLSVPLQAGTGVSWFQDEKNYVRGNRDRKYLLLLYEPGITAQFKVFKWAGLGADVAYRFTLKNNSRVGERLNSPTYSFKILFWFD